MLLTSILSTNVRFKSRGWYSGEEQVLKAGEEATP